MTLRTDWLWAALAAIASLALLGVFNLDYRRPLSLVGDHLHILVHARAMQEGAGFFVTPFLGFPFEQNTAYFPQFEPGLKAIVWLLTFLPVGPFLIVKLYYVVGIGLTAAASYWALRLFDMARWVAVVMTVAFIACPYFEFRALGHDYLAIYLSAPFGCGIALLIAQCLTFDDFRAAILRPFTAVGLLVIATSGIYYAFFSLFFISMACLSATLRLRSVVPVLAAMAMAAICLITLVVGTFGPNLPGLLAGEYSAPSRSAGHQMMLSLSISEAVATLKGIPFLETYADQLLAVRRHFNVVGSPFQWPGIFLSFVIILCPLLLIGAVGQDRRLMSRTALLSIVFIAITLTFASRGGSGYIFNLLVSPEIRDHQRIMPFLTFFAVMLIGILATEFLASDRRWVAVSGFALPLMTLVSAVPSFNALHRDQVMHLRLPLSLAAETTIPRMLEAKDRYGLTAVLQVPVAPWPEVRRRLDHDWYMDQLPFIYDKAEPPTKWSYGAPAKRPGAEAFRAQFPEGDSASFPEKARRFGFDGILLSRDAYTPEEYSAVRAGIVEQPGVCSVYGDDVRELFTLERPC